MLLVQTPWQAQTYIPVPESSITGHSRTSYDPSLPPIMSTPKFSPIPWLHPSGEGLNGDDSMTETRMVGMGESSVSPLLLNSGVPEAEEYKLQESARSPTPEPEDIDMASTTTTTSAEAVEQMEAEPSIAHSADPGSQPYLGRVDELDTGPIQPGLQSSNGAGHGNGNATGREAREDEQIVPGAGEGGAMTPHGMSEKPVPISSTTVISEEERRIAGLRQTSAQSESGATSSAKEKESKDQEEQSL